MAQTHFTHRALNIFLTSIFIKCNFIFKGEHKRASILNNIQKHGIKARNWDQFGLNIKENYNKEQQLLCLYVFLCVGISKRLKLRQNEAKESDTDCKIIQADEINDIIVLNRRNDVLVMGI